MNVVVQISKAGATVATLLLSGLLAFGGAHGQDTRSLLDGEQRLFAPDQGFEAPGVQSGAPGDRFGESMAMDGSWAVIGAPGSAREGTRDNGAVAVLKLVEESWSLVEKITPPGSPFNKRNFGRAVALEGEWMAIGGYESAPASPTQIVSRLYLYRLQEGKWTFHSQISAVASSNPGALTSPRAMGVALWNGKLACLAQASSLSFFSWNGSDWVADQPEEIEHFDVQGRDFLVHGGDFVLVGNPSSGGRVKEYRVNSGSGLWSVHRTISHPDGSTSSSFGHRIAAHDGRVVVAASDRLFYYQASESSWTLLGTIPLVGVSSISLSATHLATWQSNIGSNSLRLFKIDAGLPGSWPFTTGTLQTDSQFGRVSIVTGGGQTVVAGHNRFAPIRGLEIRGISGDQLSEFTNVPVPGFEQKPEIQFATAMAFTGDEAAFASTASHFMVPPFLGSVHLAKVDAHGQWQIGTTLTGIDSSPHLSYGYQIALDHEWLAVSFDRQLGGKVALYRKTAGVWDRTPQAILANPAPSNGGVFGFRTALRGNFLAVESYQATTNSAVTALYELAADSEPVLLDSSNLFLHRFDGDTLIGLTSPSTAASKLRFLEIRDQKFAIKRTLPKPTAFDLQQFRSNAFDVTEEAMVMPRQGTIATWRRSGNSWRAMKLQTPMQRIYWQEMQSPWCRIAGDTLLVTLENRFVVFSRTNDQWLQTMNRVAPVSADARKFAVGGGLGTDHLFVANRDTRSSPTLVSYLSIFELTDAKLLDEPTDPTSTPILGETFDAGEMLIGQRSSIPLTIQNSGARPWEITGFTLDWISAESTALQVPDLPLTLGPGQSKQIMVQVTPMQAGNFEVQLILGTNPELPAGLQVRLRMSAVAERRAPTFGVGLQPRIVGLNEWLWITPEIHATKPYSLQWLHNGRVLRGQTEPSLKINSPLPSHAGNYQLQISWPEGSARSAEVPVAIFSSQTRYIEVNRSSPISLRSQIWGDKVDFNWFTGANSDAPLMDSWNLQGTRSSILQAKRVDVLPGTFPLNVRAQASFRGVSRIIGEFGIDLKDGFPDLLNHDLSRVVRVGEEVHIGDTILSATGLPPGLRLSRDRTIDGIPTRVGRYRSTIRTALPHNKSWTGIHTFVVLPRQGNYYGPAGGYVGSGSLNVEIPLPETAFTRDHLYASAKVQVSGDGAVSGTLQVANHIRRFRLKMLPDASDPSVRRGQVDVAGIPGIAGLRLELGQNAVASPDESDTWLTVNVLNPELIENQGGSFMLAPLANPSGQDRAFLSGRFNATTTQAEPPEYGPSFPTVAGVFSGTLSGGKTLRYVLRLPTGEPFMGAADLASHSEHYRAGFMHYLGRNVVSGAVLWDKNRRSEEDANPEMYGSLVWHLGPEAGSASYPEGFVNAHFGLTGAKHFRPLRGQPIFSNLTHQSTNAVIMLDHPAVNPAEDQALSLPIFLGPQNQITLPSAQQGVRLPSLNLNLNTGWFTGTMEHQASSPGANPTIVPITGVFIPGQNRAGGDFQLPVTSLDSNLEVGSISILSAPTD